jgi:tRNA modification GTPase
MLPDEDTIAAIATPTGQAGIGIIRMSGPSSCGIAKQIFRMKNPEKTLESHHLYLGHLYDPSSGETIDEVLLSFMRAPHSYTKEDVVEINSHSGYLLLSKILEIILNQGARLARPGEFTLRAFLNGRIDLTQAEGVMDLINAKSTRGLHLAAQQTQGLLKDQIGALREEVAQTLSLCEAAIDFPEEEIGIMSTESMANRIEHALIKPTEVLIEAHAEKRLWMDGVKTAIVGRVNAGKSSLLNRLLNEQRAIVTPIPGTTRDIIQSFINVEGLPLHLMDTAGLGQPRDPVEEIGIRLAEKTLNEADFLLVVIDQSQPLNRDDLHILSLARRKKALIVINKADLRRQLSPDAEKNEFHGFPVTSISALTGEGLDALKKSITHCLLDGHLDVTSSHVAPNLRHRNALAEALGFFRNAAKSTRGDAPVEIVALDLRSGIDALGEITGETTAEEILDRIFGQFCIGK